MYTACNTKQENRTGYVAPRQPDENTGFIDTVKLIPIGKMPSLPELLLSFQPRDNQVNIFPAPAVILSDCKGHRSRQELEITRTKVLARVLHHETSKWRVTETGNLLKVAGSQSYHITLKTSWMHWTDLFKSGRFQLPQLSYYTL